MYVNRHGDLQHCGCPDTCETPCWDEPRRCETHDCDTREDLGLLREAERVLLESVPVSEAARVRGRESLVRVRGEIARLEGMLA